MHFHFGSLVHNYNLLPDGLDMLYWNKTPTAVIVHYHGSDIRWKNNEKNLTNKLADKILVSSPDLLDHAPSEAEWLPRSLDIAKIEPIYPSSSIQREIKIVHAPTRRNYKGTQKIINSVKMLRSENYPINLHIIENKDHEEAIQEYSKADIIIDWVNRDFGIYGMFGIEGMALGKPVLSSTNNLPHAVRKNCPVIDVNEDNITKQIAELIENPDMIRANGVKCRQFAENNHNVDDTVNQLNEIYSNVLKSIP
jgi:glycosyltransferase involved in cell wall biosynthesis